MFALNPCDVQLCKCLLALSAVEPGENFVDTTFKITRADEVIHRQGCMAIGICSVLCAYAMSFSRLRITVAAGMDVAARLDP